MPDNEEDELKQLKQIADDDYVYRLVGVNVHVGTADHGHYYSLINTRRGADEPRPEVDEERWRKIESD
jgi:predicted methyltransferase